MIKFLILLLKATAQIILSIILIISALIHHPLEKWCNKIIEKAADAETWYAQVGMFTLWAMAWFLDFIPKYLNKYSAMALSKIKHR